MSDIATEDQLPLDASEAWLAAYALGLAYSDNADQQRLTRLLNATQSCPELLDAAYRRLDGADVAEPSICDAALRLLDRARVRVERDLSRTLGP